MKADAKPTLEDVAMALCKGAAPPDWIVARLREWVSLIADTTKDQGDDDIDRLLFKSALHLQRLLPLYTVRVYEMIGEEYPACIDDLDRALDELIPILAEGVERSEDQNSTQADICAQRFALRSGARFGASHSLTAQRFGKLVRLIGLPVVERNIRVHT